MFTLRRGQAVAFPSLLPFLPSPACLSYHHACCLPTHLLLGRQGRDGEWELRGTDTQAGRQTPSFSLFLLFISLSSPSMPRTATRTPSCHAAFRDGNMACHQSLLLPPQLTPAHCISLSPMILWAGIWFGCSSALWEERKEPLYSIQNGWLKNIWAPMEGASWRFCSNVHAYTSLHAWHTCMAACMASPPG